MKMLVVFVVLVHVSHHASAVDVYEGDEIQIPCQFNTFEMERPPMVVWSRLDLIPSTIHQRQQEGDELKDQNQVYRDRTSMRTDALETGDLSLTLTKLVLSDSGTYTCSIRTGVWEEVGQKEVLLQVEERFPFWAKVFLVLLVLFVLLVLSVGFLYHFRQYLMPEYLVEVDSGEESVLLPCKTIIRLPVNVTVEWTDRGKNKVHVYKKGSSQPKEQTKRYQDRTQMRKNFLKARDLSLTLRYPTDTDRDTFTCTAYSRWGIPIMKKRVVLQVKVCQVEEEQGKESVTLPYETMGNLPTDGMLLWKREEPEPAILVYKNTNGCEETNPLFSGRTTIVSNFLESGNLSLTLHNPRVSDTGRYRCEVFNKEGNYLRLKVVLLNIKERNQDKIDTMDV